MILPEKEITKVVLQTKTKFPELRVGQIIANAVRCATGAVNCDPYFISDDVLLLGLKEILESYE